MQCLLMKSEFLGYDELNLIAGKEIWFMNQTIWARNFSYFLRFLKYGTCLDTELGIKKENNLRLKRLL